MTENEILEIAKSQSARFGDDRLVPRGELRPINRGMAKELYSLGIPICFDQEDEYIVATYSNPFEDIYDWYAWVEEDSERSEHSEGTERGGT